MFKAIGKTVFLAMALVGIPMLLIIIGIVLSVIGPIAGVLLIMFLPLVLVGVMIGYKSAKDEEGE